MTTSSVTFPGLGLALNVKNVAFSVFGIDIYWYGIIIALGFLLAVGFCLRAAHIFGITQDHVITMLLFAVPLAIIGARLYYILFYLDLYRRADGSLDWGRMALIRDGGLAIYGGIIAAVLTLLVFCRVKKIPFAAFADLGAFGLLIGQAVGRWGNFVNVEAFGADTTVPWRMGVEIWSSQAGRYVYHEVHPTFLYECLWNLVGLAVLAVILKRYRRFDGQLFLTYVAWYGLGRGWIEGLRADSLYVFHTGLRVSQVLALGSAAVCIALLVWQLLRRRNRPAELWADRAARPAAEAEETPQAEAEGGEDAAPEAEEDKKGEGQD